MARLVGPTGKVVAFEPQRIAYYSLCGNAVQNNLDHVTCHQAAVGAAAGKITVPVPDYRREQNFGAIDLSQDYRHVPSYPVPVVRIDDLGLTACDFVKIDVEGMERQVLEGAVETIRRFKPILYVEDDRARSRTRCESSSIRWAMKCTPTAHRFTIRTISLVMRKTSLAASFR